MSGEPYSIQRLLSLRKLTRAIADLLRAELKDYLSAMAPMLRPRNVLGDYVQGASKEGSRGSEKALLELQRLYATVASAKPYHLTNELKPPFEIVSSMPELIPVEYTHVVKSDAGNKVRADDVTAKVDSDLLGLFAQEAERAASQPESN